MSLNVFSQMDRDSGLFENATIIAGNEEAMLIDAHVIVRSARRLADRIKRGGWRLKQIYVSHAHPDHFAGLEVLRDEFPQTPILAAPQVADAIAAMGKPLLKMVKSRYKEDAPERLVVPERYDGASLSLEGEPIRLVQYQGGEASHQTAFYLPRERALIAVDLIYRGVHPFVFERKPGLWLRHLEEVPRQGGIRQIHVGHGEGPADLSVLEEMKSYLCFFMATVEASRTPGEAIDRILERYPDHLSNDYLLVRSMEAYFQQPGQQMAA